MGAKVKDRKQGLVFSVIDIQTEDRLLKKVQNIVRSFMVSVDSKRPRLLKLDIQGLQAY